MPDQDNIQAYPPKSIRIGYGANKLIEETGVCQAFMFRLLSPVFRILSPVSCLLSPPPATALRKFREVDPQEQHQLSEPPALFYSTFVQSDPVVLTARSEM